MAIALLIAVHPFSARAAANDQAHLVADHGNH
jgi:hypothetical protein